MHRSILNVSWKDRITNEQVNCTTNDVENVFRERRLCWLGHARMHHHCIPQQALYWEVLTFRKGASHGQTGKAQSRKTYKDWDSPGKVEPVALNIQEMALECGPMCPYECGLNQAEGQRRGLNIKVVSDEQRKHTE